MPSTLKLTVLFLFFSLIMVSSVLGASKKKELVPYVPKLCIVIPDLPKFFPIYKNDIFKLKVNKEIVPILDFLRTIDFSEVPEEFDIWSDTKINPYQVSLVDMKDTITIDLSTFCPPIVSHVTSDFGFRKWRHHYGIDLKVNRGDTVRCAFDGIVRITKRARDYGYYVVVRHLNGLETLYAHLSKIIVAPGDSLKSGIPLGLGGNTGRSTGPHLHFETRYIGNPINPHDLINFDTYTVNNNIFLLCAKNFDYKKEIDKIRFWTIRNGDTLGRIAMRTGISISKLCSMNGIKRTTILRLGRRIRYT